MNRKTQRIVDLNKISLFKISRFVRQVKKETENGNQWIFLRELES